MKAAFRALALALAGCAGCGDGAWPPEDAGWRARLRGDVAALVGPATRFTGRRGEARVDDDGVTVEAVARQTPEGEAAPGTLLLPPSFDESASYPAVLLLHGHAAGAGGWLDAGAPTERGLGRSLARAGFVVFAPDQRSFGGFRPGDLDHEAYTRALRAEGEVFVRLAAQDARASLAWLADQPGVDPGRLGVLGQSMGGFVALLVALAEPEVRAVVTSGIFMPLTDLFSGRNHACQHFDALREVGESAALGAALAPAAIQVHFGAEDDEFVELNHGRANSLELLDRWWAAPAAPMPELAVTPGLGHAVDPAAHLDFLRRHL